MNTITIRHFIVGLAVIIGFAVTLYTGLLFYTKEAPTDTTSYLVQFMESAGGLAPGSPVKFKGITIGTVDKVSIAQDDDDRIDALIKIQSSFKVKVGMYATLEVAGITGESLISINGTASTGALLHAKEKGMLPVIPVQKSSLQKIIHSAPEVLNGAKELIEKVTNLFDEKNKKEFDEILKNLNTIFTGVHENQENIEEIVQNVLLFTRSVNSVAQKVEGSLEEINKSNRSFQSLATSADGLIKEVAPGIKNFSTNGLNDLNHALIQLSETLNTLENFVSSLSDKLDTLVPQNQNGTYKL